MRVEAHGLGIDRDHRARARDRGGRSCRCRWMVPSCWNWVTVTCRRSEDGAQEKTRTFTTLRPQVPETCASTNSATWAFRAVGAGRSPGPGLRQAMFGPRALEAAPFPAIVEDRARSRNPGRMATRSVATVFGGSGFIGRYVVKRLAARGYVVRVVGRDTERAKDLMVTGAVGQVVAAVRLASSNPATIARADRRRRPRRQPDRHPERAPRRRLPARPGRGRRRHRARRGRRRGAAHGADLRDRRRPGEPQPVCPDQGGRREQRCARRSRTRPSCGPRSCSAPRTSSSTGSAPWR